MKQKLKQALARRKKLHIIDADRILAAILLPIFCRDGEPYILFTQRTNLVKEHKGQISFPGGAYEQYDDSLLSTALRETSEEIGLAAEKVEVLGELDDIPTVGSDFIISPFVGVIPYPYPFKLDPREVESIIEVPLSVLLNRDYMLQGVVAVNSKVAPACSYHYNGKVIWGATARILGQFLGIYTRLKPSL